LRHTTESPRPLRQMHRSFSTPYKKHPFLHLWHISDRCNIRIVLKECSFSLITCLGFYKVWKTKWENTYDSDVSNSFWRPSSLRRTGKPRVTDDVIRGKGITSSREWVSERCVTAILPIEWRPFLLSILAQNVFRLNSDVSVLLNLQFHVPEYKSSRVTHV
jgi:hypothetical protein